MRIVEMDRTVNANAYVFFSPFAALGAKAIESSGGGELRAASSGR